MTHDLAERDARTSFSDLLRDPSVATPKERLQAVVAVLLGRSDPRAAVTLGVDMWRWGGREDAGLIVQLQALRVLLELLLDGLEEQGVDLLRAELSSVLEVLNQQRQQLGRPHRGERQVGRFVLVGERVVDPLAGIDSAVLVRAFAEKLFSVHGRPLGEE